MGINPNVSSENIPGVQKQNVAWLKAQTELMVAQRKYMEEVNKTKKEDWDAQTESVKEMRLFQAAGGFMGLLGGSIGRLKENIANQLEGAFAPITNAIGGLINDIMEEGGLKDALLTVGNAITGFIDNLKGLELGVSATGESISAWDTIMAGTAAGIMTWFGGIFVGLGSLISGLFGLFGISDVSWITDDPATVAEEYLRTLENNDAFVEAYTSSGAAGLSDYLASW